MHLPSLPEPTEKPPPPPTAHRDEPIYESIQPRAEIQSKVLSTSPAACSTCCIIICLQNRKGCENGTHSPTGFHVAESWKADAGRDRENREARRRLRIVRKLQELEEDEQQQIAAQQVSLSGIIALQVQV
jgi:hypothetical protein